MFNQLKSLIMGLREMKRKSEKQNGEQPQSQTLKAAFILPADVGNQILQLMQEAPYKFGAPVIQAMQQAIRTDVTLQGPPMTPPPQQKEEPEVTKEEK